jgi:phospholipid/cholesterol/gamma-HCH transport system substrate-binding protein
MFDLKKQIRWAQVKTGIIISIALVILFLGVFFAGSIDRVVNPKVSIKATMSDVKGLKKGAPVWIYGIEEGSVQNINLDPQYGTVVTISVYKKVLRFLKKDATATVLTMGLLGDKYVELSPGTSKAAPLAEGDMINGAAQTDLKDVMETAGQSIKKVTEFVDKMGKLVEKIESSKGTLSRFLDDPALYDNLKASTKNLAAITSDITNGKGSVGLLLKDPSLYERLSASSKSLEAFSKKLESGSGTLNKLLDDDQLYARLLGAATSADEVGKKLNSPSGTIGKLIADPSLYENLSAASQRLSSILDRIDKGEGAAGVLFRDDATAAELKETVKELRMLTEDIRKRPSRYFKFSLF